MFAKVCILLLFIKQKENEGEVFMKEIQLDENRIIEALEPKRKKKNNFITIGVAAFFLPFIVVGLFQVLNGIGIFQESTGMVVMGMILPLLSSCGVPAGIALLLIGAKLSKEYENDYKQLIARHVLQACFDEAEYFPERGFTREEFRAARLIHWRNDFSYASEDLITGQHAGVEFKQSDVRITHTVGSGNDRKTVVDVDGRLVQFHYKKAIDSRILIVTDTHDAALERGLSKVEMEDVDFNRKFDVYSEDGHSVYYLLTPPFMEYLKKLCELDRNIYISFDGEDLYILRSGKGGIFVPPNGKVDVHREVEKSRQELNEIVKIIEILQLEDKAYEDKMLAMQKAAEMVSEKEGDEWAEIEQTPYVMEQSDLQETRNVPHVEVSGKGCFVTVVIVIAFIIIIFALS